MRPRPVSPARTRWRWPRRRSGSASEAARPGHDDGGRDGRLPGRPASSSWPPQPGRRAAPGHHVLRHAGRADRVLDLPGLAEGQEPGPRPPGHLPGGDRRGLLRAARGAGPWARSGASRTPTGCWRSAAARRGDGGGPDGVVEESRTSSRRPASASATWCSPARIISWDHRKLVPRARALTGGRRRPARAQGTDRIRTDQDRAGHHDHGDGQVQRRVPAQALTSGAAIAGASTCGPELAMLIRPRSLAARAARPTAAPG